jgi:hypothetical protein
VFIEKQTIMQGRFDGRCTIGTGVWIGPQSYFDACDLAIGEYVGWGPGAKVLGSEHTGLPGDIPIIQTDLEIAPVRVVGRCRSECRRFARSDCRAWKHRWRRGGGDQGCSRAGDRLAGRARDRRKSIEASQR